MPQDYSQFQGDDYAYTPQGHQRPNLFEGIVSAMEGFRAAREGRMEKARVAAERSEAKRLMLEDRELKRRGQEADIDYKKAQKDALLGKGTGSGGTGSGKSKGAKAPTSSKRAQDLYDQMMKYRFDILGDKPVNDPMDFRDPEEKAAAFAAEKQARMESLLKDPAYLELQSEYAAELDKHKNMGGILSRKEEEFLKSFYKDGFVDPNQMEESMESEGESQQDATTETATPVQQAKPKVDLSSKIGPTLDDALGKGKPVAAGAASKPVVAESLETTGGWRKLMGGAPEAVMDTAKQIPKAFGAAVDVVVDAGKGAVNIAKGNSADASSWVKGSGDIQSGLKNIIDYPEDNQDALRSVIENIENYKDFLTVDGEVKLLEAARKMGLGDQGKKSSAVMSPKGKPLTESLREWKSSGLLDGNISLFGSKGQAPPNVDIRQGKMLDVEVLPNRR